MSFMQLSREETDKSKAYILWCLCWEVVHNINKIEKIGSKTKCETDLLSLARISTLFVEFCKCKTAKYIYDPDDQILMNNNYTLY